MSTDAPAPDLAQGFGDPQDVFDQDARSSTRGNANDGFISLLSDNWPRVDDGLQIGSGGAVAVDTESLRAAALEFEGANLELASIALGVASLEATLRRESYFADDALGSASALVKRLEEVQTEAQGIADALRETANVYEYVELSIECRAAVLAGDNERVQQLTGKLQHLIDEQPGVIWAGPMAEWGFALRWPSELVRQGTQWGVSFGSEFGDPWAIGAGAGVGLATIGLAIGVGTSGAGRIGPDAKLTGDAGPVAVTPVTKTTSTRAAAVAPQSLADLSSRIPGGESRVRVERYTMADGSQEYFVYVAGTQSQSVIGGDDPWDNTSNVQLYSGQASASYAATAAAVAAAGAQPGDTVHIAGHSQGGMIATHLALEGGYVVPTLFTEGSPVSGEVGSDTLRIELRHSDDPVSGLADGGFGETVGAQGSFVAERVADPDPGLDDAKIPAHSRELYTETAAMVDASDDPRLDAVRQRLQHLAEAESVTVTEYAATRG